MDDPRQKCGFRQGHFAKKLVKVSVRSLAKPVNRKTSAVAEIDFVGVQLENLLLAEAVLALQGHHGFGNFAPIRPIRVEKETARHLHRNRAAALNASFV